MTSKRKKKTQKIKTQNYMSEEQQEIIRFVKILIIVVILIVIIYLLTRLFVTKDLFTNENNSNENITEGSVNYSTTIIGAMFTKPEEEYYVLIYNSEDLEAVYYSGLISTYQKNTDYLKVYVADLNNELNKKYIDNDNINVSTNNLSEFKVGKIALIKIKDKKITKSFTTIESIAEELAYKSTT